MSLARRLIAAGFNDLEKGERFLAAPELDGLDQDALFAGLQLAANPDTALQSLVRLDREAPGPAAPRRGRAGAQRAAVPRARRVGGPGRVPHPAPRTLGCLPRPGQPGTLPPQTPRRCAPAPAVGPRRSQGCPSVAGLAGQEGYAALRTAYRRGLVELAVKDLCAADPLTTCPRSGRTREPGRLPRSRPPWPCPGRGGSAVRRRDVGRRRPGRDRDGQVRRPRTQLHFRRRRHLRDRRRRDGRLAGEHHRHRPGLGDFAGHHVHQPGARLWEVDANLRPEGKSGPLVRTLASHESYYARWAESWEFQALLKAWTIAGDSASVPATRPPLRR